MSEHLRQPIICVLGHVDAGKTSLLDKIRGSAVALKEAGLITQHIGASFFPIEALEKISGPTLRKFKAEIKIPGLLVIDTPGHSIFMNLRRRGGSVADIAILVIDVNRGLEAQTYESINILKARKTPFVVAANKIDLINGWVGHPGSSFFESFNMQDKFVQRELDNKIYEIMGALSRLDFKSDRFDRITDFTTNVAIIPVSAKSGESISDLLAIIVGLTQQYMTRRLMVTSGPAKGTVLEVKQEPGLGATINALIYDGILRKGDLIVVGGVEKPIVTKVRAIFLPKPLDEIREPRDKFTPISEVVAAAGVKIFAPGLETALAGSPLIAVESSQLLDNAIRTVAEEIEKLKIATDKIGVVLKADALGSLEAITVELENNRIPIRLADVGEVSRRDIVEASVVKRDSLLHGVVLAFNVKTLPDAVEESANSNVPVFSSKVVYSMIENYVAWMNKKREEMVGDQIRVLVKPGKIRLMPGFVFRKSNPAIFGAEVLGGTIQPKYNLVRTDGKPVGEILQIQDKGQSVSEAKSGMQVAVSMDEPVIGRHINEGDVLYVAVPDANLREWLTKFKDYLTQEDQQVIDELITIMRKTNPVYGI